MLSRRLALPLKDANPAMAPGQFRPLAVWDLFVEAAQRHGLTAIADRIGLHPNTVRRWQEIRSVPDAYIADFRRMLGMAPDTEADRDQYFTRPETARHCFSRFRKVMARLGVSLTAYTFIEPSMGEGCFYDLFPADRGIGIDIDPCRPETHKADFLLWTPPTRGKYVVVGNPPFGLRGHLALQFINHSFAFADAVGFILPQLFESDGKGVPGKRVKGYRLAHSETLDGDQFHTPTGRHIHINTIFQVWTKVGLDSLPEPDTRACSRYITIYSLSNGGTPASTRNRHMIGKCDLYLPSTTYEGMQAYNAFHELPNERGYGVVIHKRRRDLLRLLRNHDWERTAFRSTNSAINLRRSLIEEVVKDGGFLDHEDTR